MNRVAATVRIWFPKCSSSMTSSAELTTDLSATFLCFLNCAPGMVRPSILAPCLGWQCTRLGFWTCASKELSEKRLKLRALGCNKSLICSLYTWPSAK